jgi:Phosphate transporter family
VKLICQAADLLVEGAAAASGILKQFEMPRWVIFAAYGSISLGTLSGGWRIVHTMGSRLTRLKPRSGFCAEAAAAISILFATEYARLPISTTHVAAGAIIGRWCGPTFQGYPLGASRKYSLGVDFYHTCSSLVGLAIDGGDSIIPALNYVAPLELLF